MFALKRSDIGVQMVHLGKRMIGSPIMATTTTCEIKKYMILTPALFFLFYKFRNIPIRTWMIWLVLTCLGLIYTDPGSSAAPWVYLGMLLSVLSLPGYLIILERSHSNGYNVKSELYLFAATVLSFGVGANAIEILNGTFELSSLLVAGIIITFVLFVFGAGYAALYGWMSFKKHPAIEDYINKVCRTVEIVD